MSDELLLVGNRIKRARIFRGYTQKKLADLTGIHEVLIRRYEYGDRNPKPDQLQKIATALDVDIAWLKEPKIITKNDFLFSLFEVEHKWGIELRNENGKIYIAVNDAVINNKLETWAKEKEAYEKDYISKDDYEAWKLTYPPKIEFNDEKK